MTNNNMNPGYTYARGYGNGAPIRRPKMSSPLTEEELAALRNQPVDQFNLSLSTVDLAKAFCPHRHPGSDEYATIKNPDGTLTCTICHETFDPDACTPEVINEATAVMKNVLQTLKYLGVDLSSDIIRGYFGFLPYIEKIPQLYKIVVDSYNMYNSIPASVMQENGQANAFGAFANILNPSMAVFGNNAYAANPNMVYGNPQQAAMMGGFNNGMPANPFYGSAPVNPPQGNPYYGAPVSAPTAPQAQAPVAQPDQVVVKDKLTL